MCVAQVGYGGGLPWGPPPLCGVLNSTLPHDWTGRAAPLVHSASCNGFSRTVPSSAPAAHQIEREKYCGPVKGSQE